MGLITGGLVRTVERQDAERQVYMDVLAARPDKASRDQAHFSVGTQANRN